jgi:hypothetical protein
MLAADLINELPRAECRPAAACQVLTGPDGHAIRVPSPSRITWILELPHQGRFDSTIATVSGAPVRFRLGVADNRTYEPLAQVTVMKADGARPFSVDLSAYAGWKWSLFYHPDRIAWRLILSADAVDGVPGAGVWGAPRVMTTPDGEMEYRERTRR